MKKTVYILIFILVGNFTVLSLLDWRGEYAAEKALWKLNTKFAEISKDPKSIPDATFEDLTKQYEKFSADYSYSELAPIAYIFLGRIYTDREKYDLARVKFEYALKKYPKVEEVAIEALSEIANSYAAQKDHTNLLKTYQRVLKDYPLTNLAMHAPLLIAQVHTQKNNLPQAEMAIDNAIGYYKKMIKDYPNTAVEVLGLRLLGTSYIAKRNWTAAINSFADLLNKYPDVQNPKNVDNLIKSINTIAINNLKNFELPITIYQNFIKTHPNHPFNKALELYCEKIKELKQKISAGDVEQKNGN